MKSLFAILCLLVACSAYAQQTIEVPIHWGAPPTGSPATQYIVQLSTDGGEWVDCCTSEVTSALVTIDTDHSYQARVAARDRFGRQGQWSPPSASYYADAGAPGPCGIVFWPDQAAKE